MMLANLTENPARTVAILVGLAVLIGLLSTYVCS